MTVHGTTYANACSPQGQRELRKTINDAKIPNSTQLWNVVHALLCGEPTPASERLIGRSMAITVINGNFGTGQDEILEVINRSGDSARTLMASNKAWGASVKVQKDGMTIN